jgi:hypothetical protein
MSLSEETKEALLTSIKAATENQEHPTSLLRLAEAYAWVTRPAQPHGGASSQESS